MDRTLKLALGSLAFNIAFATYYLVMGLVTNSWWLLTLGSYYLVLSLVRFMVLRSKSKERFIAKFFSFFTKNIVKFLCLRKEVLRIVCIYKKEDCDAATACIIPKENANCSGAVAIRRKYARGPPLPQT